MTSAKTVASSVFALLKDLKPSIGRDRGRGLGTRSDG
jgi:hypothetical protein